MSLKITPRGLLAALVALGIIMMQMPAITGHAASTASTGALRAATLARHAAAAVRPHDQSGSSIVNGITLSPATGPVGVPITLTGTNPFTSPSTPVTVTAAGVPLGTTTTVSRTGQFTFTATLPLTLATAAANVVPINVTTNSSLTRTATTQLTFLLIGPSSSASPASVTHGTTVALTLTNYAPGVPLIPTLVYTNTSNAISTTAFAAVTPISDGSALEGNVTTAITIPTSAAYNQTAVISLTSALPVASYPLTPTANTGAAFPSITIAATPTYTVSPTAVGAVGISQTLSLSSTSAGGFNITPGSTITFVIGLVGQPAVALPTTSIGLPPSTATGTFTATAQFTPTVPGTYVITATDINAQNVATTTFQAAVPAAPVATSYLAEGYTGGAGTLAFHTFLNILNPNAVSVIVTNTYLLETAAANTLTTTTGTAPDVVVVTHTIGPMTDIVVDVAADIASQPVSSGPDAGKSVSGTNQRVATIVRTAGFTSNPSVRGVAVERTIERIAAGKYSDGDTSLATSNPNTNYYFAEGYTGIQFQEYLVLLNPSPTLTATVNILRAPDQSSGITSTLPAIGPYVLAPYQRITLNMRALNLSASAKSIGLIVNSNNPIVAERTQYFGPGGGSAKAGMAEGQGSTTASKQLNFAYGSVVDITPTVPPTSDVQQTIDDRAFITIMNPNIAGQVVAGTTAGTAAAPGSSAHVTIQLRAEDGSLLGFFINDVDPGTRFTLTNNDLTNSAGGIGFPGVPTTHATAGATATRTAVFSAIVSSSERIVAELANYYGQGPVTSTGDGNKGAPGISLVGAPSGETDVIFPNLAPSEPIGGLGISSTVFLYNPGVNAIQVSGAFFGAKGAVTKQTYTIGPDQIQIIGQHSTDVGGTGAFSSTVSGSPIPAGTLGAEFSAVQQRGSLTGTSGEPGQDAESFVAAVISHSADAAQWWGTQGYYPLPSGCSTTTGCP